MNKPLKKKRYVGLEPYQKRVLSFDPTDIYKNTKIDLFKRVQSISMKEMFPNNKGFCGCGCNKKLEGKRTRWASDDCQKFAGAVLCIINGHSEVVSSYLRRYFGNWACCKCGLTDSYKEFKNGLCVTTIHKDHITAVMNGGGGCWLSNYQLLCEECHKEKTLEDIKAKVKKKKRKYRKVKK